MKYGFAILLLMAGFILQPMAVEQKFPNEYYDALKKAQQELDWGFYLEAGKSFLAMHDRFPDAPRIHEALGYIRWIDGKYPEALHEFEEELRIEPSNEFARILLGIVHFQSGDYLTAREHFEQIWMRHFSFIGKLRRDSLDRKFPFFRKFLQDNPGLMPFCRGIVNKAMKNWSEAEKNLQVSLDQGFRKDDVLLHLFDLHFQRGQLELAEAVWNDLQKWLPEEKDALKEIWQFRAAQKLGEMVRQRPVPIRYFQKPLPDALVSFNLSALNALKLGEISSAVHAWEKALTVDVYHFEINYNLALTLYLNSRLHEALPYALRALISSPREGFQAMDASAFDSNQSLISPFGRTAVSTAPKYLHWAYNLVGNIYFGLARYEEAIENYQHALVIDSNYYKCRNNLAETYRLKGLETKAEEEWLKVVASSPKPAKHHEAEEKEEGDRIQVAVNVEEFSEYLEACQSLARIYLKQGKEADAAAFWEKVLEIVPDDANAHFQLGQIDYRKTDVKSARKHLLKALEISNEHENEIKAILRKLSVGASEK